MIGLDSPPLLFYLHLTQLSHDRSWLHSHRPGRAMYFPVAWHINILIPVIVDKEDWLAAGIVAVAMLGPLFSMARGHAQVGGWWRGRNPVYDDSIRLEQAR